MAREESAKLCLDAPGRLLQPPALCEDELDHDDDIVIDTKSIDTKNAMNAKFIILKNAYF